MNRILQYFNALGVFLLVLLCVSQWRTNRNLNLEVNRLEKLRLEQLGKSQEQIQEIQGCRGDLEAFREQLKQVHADLVGTRVKLKSSETESAQLAAERDQLKQSVTNWVQAVAVRDSRLKEATDHIQKLAEERNEAVTKFNEIAEKYNGVVNDLNNRTREFNTLVEKYNATVKAAKREGQ